MKFIKYKMLSTILESVDTFVNIVTIFTSDTRPITGFEWIVLPKPTGVAYRLS